MHAGERTVAAGERANAPGALRKARADAQRSRILAAAEKCFVQQGFHAASMASIATTAGMSPGLIYRYFPGKHAIVLAIIDRQLEERREKIASMHAADLGTALARAFVQWQAGSDAGLNVPLFLAIAADATRDPTIAGALADSDRASRAELVAWLVRRGKEAGAPMPKRVAEQRAVLIQCLIEGLAMRAVREPALDAARLRPELRRLFEALLAP